MTEAQLIRVWTDAFVEIVKCGSDPAETADAMLTTAGLLVEQRRGTEAAKIALVAGFNLLCQQGRPTIPRPS